MLFRSVGEGLPADGNGDGVVDQADFTTWADHYGEGTPPAASAGVADNPSTTTTVEVVVPDVTEESDFVDVDTVVDIVPEVVVDAEEDDDSPAIIQLDSIGAVYYVDQINGDDDNPGTKELPWKTLQKAVEMMQPGDSVYLKIIATE